MTNEENEKHVITNDFVTEAKRIAAEKGCKYAEAARSLARSNPELHAEYVRNIGI